MRYLLKALAVAAVSFDLLAAVPQLAAPRFKIWGRRSLREIPWRRFYTTPDGRLGTFFHCDNLADLLDALPADEDMRDLTVWSLAGAPTVRLPEEQMNVKVPAYVVAVKPGEDDHDLHVIVSDRPRGRKRVFMDVEVSGLPRMVSAELTSRVHGQRYAPS